MRSTSRRARPAADSAATSAGSVSAVVWDGSRARSSPLWTSATSWSTATRSATTTRPSLRHTRRSSRSAGAGSARWWTTKRQRTASNERSGNGRSSSAARTNSTLRAPAASAASRPTSRSAPVRSATTNWRARPASVRERSPAPPPASRTRSSGIRRAHASIHSASERDANSDPRWPNPSAWRANSRRTTSWCSAAIGRRRYQRPAGPPRRSAEPVADAARGGDLGLRGDRAQLAPQPGDVLVERVVVDDRALRPRRADEVAATNDGAGLGGEGGQQAELGRRQRHLVRPLAQRARHRVEPQRADLGGRLRLGPPQQLAQPRDDLVHPQRLRRVVVAARPEAGHAVGDGIRRGEEEHGRVAAERPQRAAEVAAVRVGQRDVDDDPVGALVDVLERRPAVAQRGDLEALARERVPQARTQLVVADDDEDALALRRAVHGPMVRRSP